MFSVIAFSSIGLHIPSLQWSAWLMIKRLTSGYPEESKADIPQIILGISLGHQTENPTNVETLLSER